MTSAARPAIQTSASRLFFFRATADFVFPETAEWLTSERKADQLSIAAPDFYLTTSVVSRQGLDQEKI
jgi:hypothetical protein